MQRLATALLTIGLFSSVLPLVAPATAQATDAPVAFGMDAASIQAQTDAGVKPEYGTFWVGPWTLKSGWAGPNGQMDRMKAAGVTPAIHFYYWGDDITQSCLENGCWSSLHGSQKDKAGWDALTAQLVQNLNARMGGKPVMVFIESEFNKANVQTYEPLDGYLAEKARQIKAGYPNAQIVLSLGNWNQPAWSTWDRFAAASDYTGIQGMRGSTRDSLSHYQGLYESSLSGAKKLQALFGKPVVLQDIALSSYPEPEYVAHQANELEQFFDNLPALKAAGVEAIIYRSWRDSPGMDLANYYGQAERHWGLAYSSASGAAHKPAARVWIEGVQAERSQAPAASFTATATGLRVDVDGSASTGSGASYTWTFGDGAKATGVRASHTYASAGTYTVTLTVTGAGGSDSATQSVTAVQPNRAPQASFTSSVRDLEATFQATASDADGDELTFAWAFGDGATATGREARHTYATAGTHRVQLTVSDGQVQVVQEGTVTTSRPAFTAAITVASGSNEWWQEVKVQASQEPAKVEFQANGGAWQPMAKKSWGNWAANVHVARGTPVAFRAIAADGQAVATEPQPWLGRAATTATTAPATTAPTSAPSTAPASGFTASVTPAAGSNEWWVEAKVDASKAVAKVEAKAGTGSWVTLDKKSWGTWAKSFHVVKGTPVQFRVTATDGQTATTEAKPWLTAGSGTSSPTTTTAAPAFTAAFTPKAQTNAWWVEVKVDASKPVAKVEARVNGGAWTPLPATDWGTHAKSLRADDARVEFRATSGTGQVAYSPAYTWG